MSKPAKEMWKLARDMHDNKLSIKEMETRLGQDVSREDLSNIAFLSQQIKEYEERNIKLQAQLDKSKAYERKKSGFSQLVMRKAIFPIVQFGLVKGWTIAETNLRAELDSKHRVIDHMKHTIDTMTETIAAERKEWEQERAKDKIAWDKERVKRETALSDELVNRRDAFEQFIESKKKDLEQELEVRKRDFDSALDNFRKQQEEQLAKEKHEAKQKQAENLAETKAKFDDSLREERAKFDAKLVQESAQFEEIKTKKSQQLRRITSRGLKRVYTQREVFDGQKQNIRQEIANLNVEKDNIHNQIQEKNKELIGASALVDSITSKKLAEESAFQFTNRFEKALASLSNDQAISKAVKTFKKFANDKFTSFEVLTELPREMRALGLEFMARKNTHLYFNSPKVEQWCKYDKPNPEEKSWLIKHYIQRIQAAQPSIIEQNIDLCNFPLQAQIDEKTGEAIITSELLAQKETIAYQLFDLLSKNYDLHPVYDANLSLHKSGPVEVINYLHDNNLATKNADYLKLYAICFECLEKDSNISLNEKSHVAQKYSKNIRDMRFGADDVKKISDITNRLSNSHHITKSAQEISKLFG